MLRTFGRVRAPALGDVALDWGGLEIEQAPARTPPIFAGDSLTIFARIRERSPSRADVTLAAGGETWLQSWDLEQAEVGGPIPRLWARELIRELERGVPPGSAQQRPAAERRRHRRLVELGRRHGLVSSATSYVAVEERSDEERVEGPAELRRIPIALTAGWGGHGRLTASSRRRTGGNRLRSPRVGRSRSRGGMPQPGFADVVMESEVYLAAAAPAPAPASAVAAAASGLQKVSAAVGGLFARSDPERSEGQGERLGGRPTDRVYALLMTQKADGSFRLSAELKRWLAERLSEVELAVREHGEAVVATAVAVALLERDEISREDEWRLAARKAGRWLARNGAGFEAAAVLADPAPA